jgi:ATP-dependent Clp protease ATP-binding subunit ClpA
VIGRAHEKKMLARYLQRTSKRNVIIVGDAGVGKTAVVEGLAQRLVAADAPDFLRSLRIVQVNVADIIAGARYRGEMEERVQQIVEEVTSDPNLVLFLDEIHLVMKAGTGDGAPMDIANILKPALARDDFRCIGATTTEEFERYIKSDAAFLRRFQLLRVPEPSVEEALDICRGWARRIEQLQDVEIDDDAVAAAVTLSAQLIRGRALPDKAIDLLENAAAFVKVTSLSFNVAQMTKERPRVGRAEIEAVLEEQYGIAVRRADVLDLGRIERVLRAELIGQDEAIRAILESLGAARAREGARAAPLGVLLFVGPTGTGKTFAAECLARALFDDGRGAFIRFNLSEFKERHELARLAGAPPGFIGHDQPGALFRFVEAHPQGLILLDEVEKAHPEIQDYFLQIFDKGEALDSRGRRADFRRHLFVMTSNLIGGGEAERPRIGFDRHEGAPQRQTAAPDDALRQYFRAEFLARIDRIVAFRTLARPDYETIFDQRIAALAAELEREGVRLECATEVRNGVCQLYERPEEGVRGFLRLFERALVVPLREYLRANPDQKTVHVEWSNNRVSVT